MIDQSLGLVGYWITWLLAFVFSVFGAVEDAFRRLLDRLHVAPGLQSIILILLAIVLIVTAVRVFGGILRILLIVFFGLLLVHVLMSGRL